jgi:glycosyltransferase involved in cell wall biosynthesis
VPGVDVITGYDYTSRAGLQKVVRDVVESRSDWVVLQYNPFSYGRWGLNLALAPALSKMREHRNAPRLAVMVHEPFVPIMHWRFALMSIWQRPQFRALGRAADQLFFSISPWADQFASWFPNTPVHHLPVGSNMPAVGADGGAVRAAYGIDPDAFVIGVFGSAHPSRLLSFVGAAVHAVARIRPVHVLYVGGAGPAIAEAVGTDVPMTDAGKLDPSDVSRTFAAMDLYLAPFRKGVSTRRGSFMTGLQHGVASISTHGIHTDAMLREVDGHAVALAPDDAPNAYAIRARDLAEDDTRRRALGVAGQDLFESAFTWERIAERITSHLEESHGLNAREALAPEMPWREQA